MYIRGASSVQCSVCSTVNLAVQGAHLLCSKRAAPHAHADPALCSQPNRARQLRGLWHHAHVRAAAATSARFVRLTIPRRAPQVRVRRAVGEVCSMQLCDAGTRATASTETRRSAADTLLRREERRPPCRRPARQAVRRWPGACTMHVLPRWLLTPAFAPGNRPQPRPQMVVVENPPTMDDEGKMVRPLAVRCCACLGLHSRAQVSNMAVGVAQK